MRHIHQIGTEGSSYTYIETAISDLNEHPSVIEHPELFEIIDGSPPENAQRLIYSEE